MDARLENIITWGSALGSPKMRLLELISLLPSFGVHPKCLGPSVDSCQGFHCHAHPCLWDILSMREGTTRIFYAKMEIVKFSSLCDEMIIVPPLSSTRNFVCGVFLLLALNVTVTSEVMWELFSGIIEACEVTGMQSCSLREGNGD